MSFEGSRATIIKDLSGNIVPVTSGIGLNVNLAGGSSTAAVSGQTVAIWGASGRNSVYITDQTNSNTALVGASFDGYGATIHGINTKSEIIIYDQIGNKWNRLRSTVSGGAASQNGIQFRLLSDITQGGSNLKTGAFVPATALSGGIGLAVSGVMIHGIRIKVISGEIAGGNIHIGSSGSPPWVSGGYQLGYGETVEFKAHNPVFIRVWGSTSGIPVSWVGVDF